MSILRFVHSLTFVFWYGTLLFFTFVQAPVLFKSLPREMFGLVQSKLFPAYYLISYVCGTVMVVSYSILHPMRTWGSQDYVKITALCLMLLLSMAQGLWIGPRVAKLRVERQAAEQAKDTAKVLTLSGEFGKAHALSSLLNLLVILAGAVYLFYFSRIPRSSSDFLKGVF